MFSTGTKISILLKKKLARINIACLAKFLRMENSNCLNFWSPETGHAFQALAELWTWQVRALFLPVPSCMVFTVLVSLRYEDTVSRLLRWEQSHKGLACPTVAVVALSPYTPAPQGCGLGQAFRLGLTSQSVWVCARWERKQGRKEKRRQEGLVEWKESVRVESQ